MKSDKSDQILAINAIFQHCYQKGLAAEQNASAQAHLEAAEKIASAWGHKFIKDVSNR